MKFHPDHVLSARLETLFTTIGSLMKAGIDVEKSNLSGTRYTIEGIKAEYAKIILEPCNYKLFIYKKGSLEVSVDRFELKQIRNYSSVEELIAVLKETYLEEL